MSVMKYKLKQLESILQGVDGFEDPKILLEQYQTRPHIAACMLHTIESSFGDIADKMVCDLGAGTGILGLGAGLLGAASVHCFDMDSEALSACQENFTDFDQESDLHFDFILCDIRTFNAKESRFFQQFDTVIMNPPFGTKHNQGLDMIFLKNAIDLCTGSVYSLHKTSTREHVLKKAKDFGVQEAKVLAELRYDLPNTYKHHKKRSVDINVDLFRFKK